MKSQVIDVEIEQVRAALARAEARLERDDFVLMSRLADTLELVTRKLRDSSTTIARLRRLFGIAKSSEKTADVLGDHQRESQGDRPSEVAHEERDDDGTGGVPQPNEVTAEKPRKGHGRIGASEYEGATRIPVPHPSLCAGAECPECSRGKLYPLRPACIVRIVGQPPLAATIVEKDRYRCNACGKVYTAPTPDEARGDKYDESAVAMMALLRYGMGMPLNRLDNLQYHLGVPLPASTQWQVVSERMDAVRPVYEKLVALAAAGSIVHNDDTYARVLQFMGKRRSQLLAKGELPDADRTGLFTTAIVSITVEGPIALFFTGRKHAGENLGALLDQRAPHLEPPIQMGDALARNVPAKHPVIEANCLAHGRRNIVDEVENFPEECRYMLETLGKVFKHDELCEKQSMSDEERLRFHQQHSAPLMSDLEAWMKAQLDERRIEPNSGMGEAIQYLLRHWHKLTLFLRKAGAPIDNNICERALKMAIIHRKNSLFYLTERGARVGDIYMTLIHTADLHGVHAFDYLVALHRHAAEVAARPEDWLPWNYTARIENKAA